MTKEGIIKLSSTPWSVHAAYAPKCNREVRICVDLSFVQLNNVTNKDSYPVPRADGPRQMVIKMVFPKIDRKSVYWPFPMQEQSIEKIAFCPGPGYGLWEFTVMPYGLTEATDFPKRTGLNAERMQRLCEHLHQQLHCVQHFSNSFC